MSRHPFLIGVLWGLLSCAVIFPLSLYFNYKPKVPAKTTTELIKAQDTEEKERKIPVPQFNCDELGGQDNCTAFYSLDTAIEAEPAMYFMVWVMSAKQQGVKNVVIQIASPGGEMVWGYRMIRVLENVGINSYCVADFQAASMAFALLQSCTHRLMTRRTFIMTHEPQYTSIKIDLPNANELDNNKDKIKAYVDAYNLNAIRRMKITIEEYKAKVANGRQWFMDWNQAIKYGVVDGIVPSVWDVTRALQEGRSL